MASRLGPGLLALQLEPSRALVRVTWDGCGPVQFWPGTCDPGLAGQRLRGHGSVHLLLVF